jgi:hypothetical protein
VLESTGEIGKAVSGFVTQLSQPKPMFAGPGAKQIKKKRPTASYRKKTTRSTKPKRKKQR